MPQHIYPLQSSPADPLKVFAGGRKQKIILPHATFGKTLVETQNYS